MRPAVSILRVMVSISYLNKSPDLLGFLRRVAWVRRRRRREAAALRRVGASGTGSETASSSPLQMGEDMRKNGKTLERIGMVVEWEGWIQKKENKERGRGLLELGRLGKGEGM